MNAIFPFVQYIQFKSNQAVVIAIIMSEPTNTETPQVPETAAPEDTVSFHPTYIPIHTL